MSKEENNNNSCGVVGREQLNVLLELILKPVVRFCLRRAIRFQQFSDILKGVFVRVGKEELDACCAKASVSRLAVMTGVHRKDIGRILDSGGQAEMPCRSWLNKVSSTPAEGSR